MTNFNFKDCASNLKNLFIILFFIASVFLFSSVSAISKLILFVVLIFIFFINIYIKKFNYTSFNPTFLIFLVYLFINTFLFSKIPSESKFELLNFLLYGAVFYIFSDLEDINKDVLHFSFFLVLSIFLMLYIFYKEKAIYFFVYNPNVFSGWCILVFLFSLVNIVYSIPSKFVIFLKFNLIASFVFLILLRNISGIFVSLIFLNFLFFKKWSLFLLVLIFGLSLGVVFNFTSILDRIIWFVVGIKMWVDNPVFGAGLGSFKFGYPYYSYNLPLSSSATTFVHSYFLHIFVETGIVGGFFLIFFILSVFIKSFNFIESRIYLLPALGILLQNLIDYNLLIPQNSIIFFSFLGLSQRQHIIKENKALFIKKIFMIVFLILLGVYNSFYFHKIMILIRKNDFQKVVNIDKTCWYAYRKLGEKEFHIRSYKEAEKYFLASLKYNPFDAESYFYLSVISLKLGQVEWAYKYLKKAIRLNPKASVRYKKELEKEI